MSFKLPFWSPSQAEAIIFDWDGVIAETKLDFSGLREKYYDTRRAMLLEDAWRLTPDRHAALMSELEGIEIGGAMNAAPVPGIMDVIHWTEENGIPWAVVSRNCRKSILIAARVISIKLPDIVRSRDDGDCVKPDPRALAETCAALGADVAQTLLIGDYIYDMIGARRAGMRGVLVREKTAADWDEWLECVYGSMDELQRELDEPGEITPWEYLELVQRHGRDFLRSTVEITARVPDCEKTQINVWLATAASFGVGAFAAPDVVLSPRAWKKNRQFDPRFMGAPLSDAIRDFLRTRFPLVSVVPDDAPAIDLPSDPNQIENFLLSMAKLDG
ncbi:MAG: HAD-IA family hydrolase [Synergistaceae bacterium]|jgi:HAD superfamily hydrolase (TIGR01549 family)|nr:HAD-IA family hydrolase [Synergistaceae bacterium]